MCQRGSGPRFDDDDTVVLLRCVEEEDDVSLVVSRRETGMSAEDPSNTKETRMVKPTINPYNCVLLKLSICWTRASTCIPSVGAVVLLPILLLILLLIVTVMVEMESVR
jgi:hypothetical protein